MLASILQDPAGPSGYGKNNSKQVSKLIDIADLDLLNYAEAKGGIAEALSAKDEWARYWGCITADSFSQKDQLDIIKKLAASDPNLMVRTRAGEYLALVGETKAAIEAISAAAMKTEDPVELNLILNSAAMVFEMDPEKNKFDLPADKLKTNSKLAKERISYLATGKKQKAKLTAAKIHEAPPTITWPSGRIICPLY